jgi:glycosyltransferase involved in cell wall biosynthesis
MTDVIKRLREIDPDVVYFRGAGGVLAACAWYSRRFGKKLIFAAAHDMDFLPGRIFGLERHELLLYRLGVRWSDAILVQNRQQQARLRERFGRSSVIVPNCYAESSVRNAKQDGPVLWVANVMPRKRPEMFLDLAARHPHRHFLMVGGPSGDSAEARDYFNTIEARARALSNLDMAGYVPFSAVGQYFDGASVHVSTSAAEGFPNTFLQAWIRSVPTLSFVAPTTSDDSIGTVACIDLDEMNCRLTQLLEDKESWRESSRKANQHFLTHHAVDVIIPMYERLFSRVIGQFA